MDFTTMDDTAAYTAEAALDATTPRSLRIAGAQISAAGLAWAASQATGKTFRVLRGGSLDRLQTILHVTKALTPDTNNPFPVWQGMQYLQCMYDGAGMLTPLDNARYPKLTWTGVREVLGRGDPETGGDA